MALESTYCLVELSRLSCDTPYRYRDPLDLWGGTDALRSSISRAGVLTPLWVRETGEGGALELVHGHRRVEVARELGLERVPALMLEGEPAGLLIQTVEAHTQGADQNLREVARAVEAAITLGLDEQQVARRLMPALGMEPHPELVSRHRRLLSLPEELLQLLLRKGFSLRRCLPFCDVSPPDARLLASVCQGLGARQIEQTATSLREISARDSLPLGQLVQELGLDPADTAGLLRLDGRRHPETTALRRRAAEVAGELGGQGARVSFDRNFTRGGVELWARLNGVDDLERLIKHLEQPGSQALLQRLLDLIQ